MEGKFYAKGMTTADKKAMKIAIAEVVASVLANRKELFPIDDVRYQRGEVTALAVIRTYNGPVMFEVRVKESI